MNTIAQTKHDPRAARSPLPRGEGRVRDRLVPSPSLEEAIDNHSFFAVRYRRIARLNPRYAAECNAIAVTENCHAAHLAVHAHLASDVPLAYWTARSAVPSNGVCA